MAEKQSSTEPSPGRLSGVPPNTVLIGKKPLMAYCTAIVMQANTGGGGDISVKARGRAISKAVDVVEVCRRRFFEGKLEIADVLIGTETIASEGEQSRNVSTIEIKLRKRA